MMMWESFHKPPVPLGVWFMKFALPLGWFPHMSAGMVAVTSDLLKMRITCFPQNGGNSATAQLVNYSRTIENHCWRTGLSTINWIVFNTEVAEWETPWIFNMETIFMATSNIGRSSDYGNGVPGSHDGEKNHGRAATENFTSENRNTHDGSVCMAYMLTWMGYIDGKWHTIYSIHTRIRHGIWGMSFFPFC